jgi:hypothetical protein
MQILFQDVADFWRQGRTRGRLPLPSTRSGASASGRSASRRARTAGTQTIQQHLPHSGEIAEGTRAVPELGTAAVERGTLTRRGSFKCSPRAKARRRGP